MRARLRAAWRLHQRGADAAQPAARRGGRARLLRVRRRRSRSPTRRSPARRRPRLRRCCSASGASAWCSAASSSRARCIARCGMLLSCGDARGRARLPRLAVAPALAVACVAGAGRRDRQRRAVGVADQRRAAADAARPAGRLMGAVESIGALCPAIGLSLGGALVALSSPRTRSSWPGSARR